MKLHQKQWFIVLVSFLIGIAVGWLIFGKAVGKVDTKAAIKRLKSSDPIQRTEAAWELALKPTSEAVDELANLLLDREDSVRLASAVALSRIGEPAISPTLRIVKKATEEALRTPQQVLLPGQFLKQPRDAAIFILAHIAHSSEGAKKVAKLLESEDPMEVSIAQQALQQVGTFALPVILPYLEHKRREVRFAALSVVSACGEQAIDALRKFIVENEKKQKTPLDQETKQMAVYALGNTKSDKALPVLKEAIKDKMLETAVWHAIGNLKTEGAKNFLLEQAKKFFKEGKNPPPAMISAIGSSQLTEAIPYLRHWLRSSDARVQEASALALGMLRDKSSVPMLIPLLQSKDVGLASTVANALTLLADPRALPELYKALERVKNPTDLQVVLNSLVAIQSINERSSIPVLEKFLSKPNIPEIVRKQAKSVLDYLQQFGRF